MKILFIGSDELIKYASEEMSEKENHFLEVFPLNEKIYSINQYREDIIAYRQDVIIIDLTTISDDEELITKSIKYIEQATRSKIIIYCNGYNEESTQIKALKAVGISDYIYYQAIGLIKTELVKCFNSKTEVPEEVRENIIANRELHNNLIEEEIGIKSNIVEQSVANIGHIKKIGFCGSMKRIGTTTASIQLVKYLNLKKEGSACYIGSNPRYVENLKKYYNCKESDDGSILYEDVRLFNSLTKLSDILAYGFTYLIYDYGDFENVDMASLLERDIVVVVAGVGPSELEAFSKVINNTYNNPLTNYIFMNVSEKDREETLGLMKSLAEKSFFYEHSYNVNGDPYVYNSKNEKIFERIMETKVPQIDKEKRKKTNLFGRIYGGKNE